MTDTPATAVVSVDDAAEADLIRTLKEACGWLHYRFVHFRPARTLHGWRTAVEGDGKGWPDVILVHDTAGVMFVEVKAAGGRLTMEQEQWGHDLTRAGGAWRMVRGQVEMGAFIQELATKASRA